MMCRTKAFEQAQSVLNAYKDVKLIMAICSPGVPGAAEAVKQSGRTDVHVVGLGLPNENKPYVHAKGSRRRWCCGTRWIWGI
jgi:ABC-type sugar transport system substrate-binding protein